MSVPNLKPLANTNGKLVAKDQDAEIHFIECIQE